MDIISKDRFTDLWNVLVEQSTVSNGMEDCPMKITNGVSQRLGDYLESASNDEKQQSLSSKYADKGQ